VDKLKQKSQKKIDVPIKLTFKEQKDQSLKALDQIYKEYYAEVFTKDKIPVQ